jgi:hypothetical protein
MVPRRIGPHCSAWFFGAVFRLAEPAQLAQFPTQFAVVFAATEWPTRPEPLWHSGNNVGDRLEKRRARLSLNLPSSESEQAAMSARATLLEKIVRDFAEGAELPPESGFRSRETLRVFPPPALWSHDPKALGRQPDREGEKPKTLDGVGPAENTNHQWRNEVWPEDEPPVSTMMVIPRAPKMPLIEEPFILEDAIPLTNVLRRDD